MLSPSRAKTGKSATRKSKSARTRDPLEVYRQKRDFAVTPEPDDRPTAKSKRAQRSFVVQKHAARNLHYDFRLELNGVLLSWSVPKGPSLVRGERRLAVRTEDHPLAYADFEGIIPQGEYGGGTVIVWDHGKWLPEGDPQRGLAEGRLTFALEGEKLHGRFHLVRTAAKSRQEQWLLFHGAEGASKPGAPPIIESRPESVTSGRTVEEVAAAPKRVWRSARASTSKVKQTELKQMPTRKRGNGRASSSTHLGVVELVKKLPVQFPLTHLDKLLYPEQGLRKAELIAYYASISEWMLPHVDRRPLTLVRCPEGRHKHCFYQKHAGKGVPDIVERIAVAKAEDEGEYMMIHDAMGLVAMAQMGALEIHTWQCRAPRVEQPDQLVFDFDPDEALPWEAVVAAAFDLKKLLDQLELTSFVKTTGGKGLHVLVPLTGKNTWQQHIDFARAVVESMAAREPKRFVTEANKRLRKDRIFLDYLRNGRGATAIAPYSTRAREGAPVSAPVTWEELSLGIEPASFRVTTILARLRGLKRDPWSDVASVRQGLSAAIRKVVKR